MMDEIAYKLFVHTFTWNISLSIRGKVGGML